MPVSSDLLKSLAKEYNEKIVFMLSDTESLPIEAISTGALSVDYNSGIGGIPRGRITELFGPESSGKSTLCQNVVAHAQLDKLNVAYIDTEQSFDREYAAICGVNITDDSLVFSQPDSLETALELAEKFIASKEFGLIVVDSVVGISPLKESEDDLQDANVSLISRLLTKFCRRNIYAIRDSNVALLVTNQVRDKIGAYVPTLETTGGHALKHFAGMRIQTSRTADIKEGADNIIGVQYKAVFKKNKVAAPYRTGKYSIYFGKGIWRAEDVLTNAIEFGIMSMRGSYIVYNGDVIAQGKVNAVRVLEETPEIMEQITKDLLDQIKQVKG
jgi:recombination protein RecA